MTSSGLAVRAVVWDRNEAANQIKAFVPLFIHIVDQHLKIMSAHDCIRLTNNMHHSKIQKKVLIFLISVHFTH